MNSGTAISGLLLLAAIIFSFWADRKVKKTYSKYSNVRNSRNITGAEAARLILDRAGLQDVPIAQTTGTLSDY